jgi:hypothetical protein
MSLLACLVLSASAAFGQATRPTSQPAVFTGTVTASNVYVRTAPANSPESYPCVKLSAPAVVVVLEEKDGWLKIAPPEGAFSLVAKEFVRTDPASNVGTVTGTNVIIRAGSAEMPSRTECIQGKLAPGDKLTVLGEQGRFYKITPPPSAFLYVSAQYVQKNDGTGFITVRDVKSDPTTLPTATRPTRPGITNEQIKLENDAIAAADQAWKDTFALPMQQRDLKALLTRYQELGIPANSPNYSYVQTKTGILQNQLDTAASLEVVNQQVREAAENRAKVLKEIEAINKRPLPEQMPATYAAEGVLSASELFTGGATGPRRYVITNPDTRLISAYVQCTTNSCDLSSAIGSHVGVQGKPIYDKEIKLYVIEATQVVVLKPKPAPAPPPTRVLPVSAPTTSARARPASDAGTALPPTGLPVAEPTSQPVPVDSHQFD